MYSHLSPSRRPGVNNITVEKCIGCISAFGANLQEVHNLLVSSEPTESLRERLVEDLPLTIRAAFEFLLPRSANKQKLRALQARHPHLGMLRMATKRHCSEQIITDVRGRVERRGITFADDDTAARATRMLTQLCSIPIELFLPLSERLK